MRTKRCLHLKGKVKRIQKKERFDHPRSSRVFNQSHLLLPSSVLAAMPPPRGIFETYAGQNEKSILPPHPVEHSDPLSAPKAGQSSTTISVPSSVEGVNIPLPFPIAWTPSKMQDGDLPPNFDWVGSHCGGRAVIGVIGGGVMGLGMGVFLGAMSDMTPPVTVYQGKEVPIAPLKEQARAALRQTGEKSLYWCRNFAFITGVFSGSECVVEKVRCVRRSLVCLVVHPPH